MKRILQITIIVFIICAFALAHRPAGVQAFPPLPCSFYGTVKLNGANVANGTLIEAVVNGNVFAQAYTQMYEGDSVYSIIVPGDDGATTVIEGAREGDAISFRIGGIAAQQTATWRSGINEKLDLSATTSSTPNTPAPTPTSYPTQTAIPTQKNTAIFTRTPTRTVTAAGTHTPPPAQFTPAMTMTAGGGEPTSAPVATVDESDATSQAAEFTPAASLEPALTEATAAAITPTAGRSSRYGIIYLGAGILLALGVLAWLFYRQLKR